VRAPTDGVVLKVLAESAQVIAAGAPIAEIGDPRDMEIVVDLLSADAVRVRPGAEARIEDWGGSGALAARIRRIEPSAFTKVSALGIEEQRVNVTLDLLDHYEEWERLGHGFRVYVRISVWRGEDVVRVPLAALFRRGADWSVFRVVDGTARATSVTIDHRDSEYAEVTDGLAPGATVIVHPSDQVGEGVTVEPRADG
jgi:HlyD family secretion protein